MRFSTSSALAVAAVLPQAFAHYNFDALILNGAKTGPYEYVRALGPNTGNGPMHNVLDPEFRCNIGSFANAATTKTAPVKAGDTVGFNINSVLGHEGPLMVYMSKSTTPDITTYEGDGDWFKIYEMGVKTFANYQVAMTWWATGWTEFNFTIPAGIEDGQYLLRAEHMATHSAGSDEGAQFYMGCAQIEVTGGTPGAQPGPLVKIPGVYGMRDPGIYYNPFWPPVVNYTMPGPEVYPPGGSFPAFTADPNGPAASQPLPATMGGAASTPRPVTPPPATAPSAPASALSTVMSAAAVVPSVIASAAASVAPTASATAAIPSQPSGTSGACVRRRRRSAAKA